MGANLISVRLPLDFSGEVPKRRRSTHIGVLYDAILENGDDASTDRRLRRLGF